MKKKLWVTLIVILLALPAILVLLLARAGFFSNAEVSETEMGPLVVVYEDHKGPYKGTAKVMDRIYYSLLEDGIETFRGIGIYYDKPGETAEEDLRSKAGCVVESSDTTALAALKPGYQIMTLPRTRYVTASIPFRGPLSVFAGIVKVYPAIGRYMEEQGYPPVPAIEIYDHNERIVYLFEIREE